MASLRQNHGMQSEGSFEDVRGYLHNVCANALGICDRVQYWSPDAGTLMYYSIEIIISMERRTMHRITIGGLTRPEYRELVDTLEDFTNMVHESAAA